MNLTFTRYTLHLTPCTLHPTPLPYTLHPTGSAESAESGGGSAANSFKTRGPGSPANVLPTPSAFARSNTIRQQLNVKEQGKLEGHGQVSPELDQNMDFWI